MASRAVRFREADVTRAIRAANKAGAADVRIEIAPDGRMVIMTGAGAATPPAANSFD